MADLELSLAAGRAALFGWTADGHFECSPAWLGQLGLEADEAPQTFAAFLERVHPDDAGHFEARWRAVVSAARTEPFECEYRLRHRAGEHRWCRAVIEAFPSEGRLRAAQVDVHAHKIAEARLLTFNVELARVVSAREDFLASMSHELRTPLNAVLGQAQALTEGTFGALTPPMREALDVISASGRHLLSLLNTVLDLARLEAGAMTLSREHVGVVALCREALHVVRPQANQKQVELELLCAGLDDEVASLDRLRARQIVVNLLSNAVKFSPARGRVRLELRRESDAWSFSVADDGPGIDALDQRRLFHPFVQTDTGRARRADGAGLGLALVKRLVDLHGGSIALESAVGRGSRFTVRLPLEHAGVSEVTTPLKLRALTSALIVDDTVINVEPLRRFLARLGVEVRTADSGPEALRLVEVRAPQVIFLDLHMPGMDGLEVARRLREAPWSRGVKIIVLTALAGDHVRHDALAAGADAFLTKPARLAEAATLADALARGSVVTRDAA